MTTPVFTQKEIIRYAQTRLSGSNVRSTDVHEIHLHNGVLPSELDILFQLPFSGFSHSDLPAIRVEQQNGREPIFYRSDGELHIPQYSGFGRRRRYEELINAYIAASYQALTFTSHDRNDDPRQTNIFYDNFAYDFVKKLFAENPMADITTIIIGPTNAVARQAPLVKEMKTEYLDSQLVMVADKEVLNIGYVYADQAGIIIDKMLREYEAAARTKKSPLSLAIYMFGRVGGLDARLQRHDLVFPVGMVSEIDVAKGKALEYPLHNSLGGQRIISGFNLNASSVVGETKEILQSALERGCLCVDMEIREVVGAINRGRERYQGMVDISFGFVGHVSDLPLKGDTLATELDSNIGEKNALETIIEAIEEKKKGM